MTAAPLIVTAALGAADFAWAERLRRAHYPPERNLVPAHLTLFRHLPPSVETELREQLARVTRGARPPAEIEGVIALGSGVAIAIRSPALLGIREELAHRLAGLLMPQDMAPPRLHITIQNKVTPALARVTLAGLRESIMPRPLAIAGLSCWRYAGGSWLPIATHAFRGSS